MTTSYDPRRDWSREDALVARVATRDVEPVETYAQWALGFLGHTQETTDHVYRAEALEEALTAVVSTLVNATRDGVAFVDTREFLAGLAGHLANDARLRLVVGA